jgi:glutaconate CoA-transferase subunit A
MYGMVQAGSMGLTFVAVRGLLHSDILKYRHDFLIHDNPFNPGEPVVLVRPIRPDLAVFHALKADRWGNAIMPGKRDDLMMARAARLAVVTAEEVVDEELTIVDARQNTCLPAIDVDIVTPVPFGAHPCSCEPLYPAGIVPQRNGCYNMCIQDPRWRMSRATLASTFACRRR